MESFENILRREFPGIAEKDILEYVKSADNYENIERFQPSTNIPQGKLQEVNFQSEITYPGKNYKLNIYTPYCGSVANSKILFILDGSTFLNKELSLFSFPIKPILDRLIFNKKVPPLLCVFIDPASIGPGYPYYGGTDNRSFEYDTASIDYANFLTNEVIIELKNRFSISDSPDDRAIMGASSGGVAAFGVAWHRPDQFRKVISSIGSYVNIRGGDAYIDLVRKTEKKPLKIYLQDGINDLNTIFGDWRLANEQLASSLAYRDYNFIFTQGNGGHNYVHLSEVIEPALIWIWSN